jgi:3-deoxy-D-manno-octulosonic-acid transferase
LPVIGPHWDNFAWVGGEIVGRDLVRVAPDWRRAAEMLIAITTNPPRRQSQRQAARAYLNARRGGSAQACREIESLLA